MSALTRARLASALKAARIVRIHEGLVRLWHEREAALSSWEQACRRLPVPEEPIARLAAIIGRINTYQWHEEDRARDTDASDETIAAVKRSIDCSNQRRVDAIEELDAWLESAIRAVGVVPGASAPLNSETPGSLVDRLSILVLKLYHMAQQAKRPDITAQQRARFASKLRALGEQKRDLTRCLDELMAAVLAGRRRFKTYRQFKMYNDPETNPYIKAGARPAEAR